MGLLNRLISTMTPHARNLISIIWLSMYCYCFLSILLILVQGTLELLGNFNIMTTLFNRGKEDGGDGWEMGEKFY